VAKEKAKQSYQYEVIVMPPLRMVLTHANDKPVGKAVLAAVIKKIAPRSVIAKQTLDPKIVKRLIEHLENEL